MVEGSFNDTKRTAFTSRDIRFTTRTGIVYAIALAWPADGKLVIRSLARGKGTVTSVSLLGRAGKVDWTQDEAGLTVSLPSDKPCDFAYSLKVTVLPGT